MMRKTLTAADLDILNLILARDPVLADHVIGKIEATNAALGPVATSPAAPEKGPKRPLPETGPGDQPGKIDRENHARIVGYLRTNGPTGPAAVKAALNLTEGEWIRGLTGDPKIIATGKGAGRKYAVEGKRLQAFTFPTCSRKRQGP